MHFILLVENYEIELDINRHALYFVLICLDFLISTSNFIGCSDVVTPPPVV